MRKLTAQEALERLNLPKMRGENYELVYTKSDELGNSIYIFSKSDSYIITSSAEAGIQNTIGFGEGEFTVPVNVEDLEPFDSYVDSLLKMVKWTDENYSKLPSKYKDEEVVLTREPKVLKANISPLILTNNIDQRTYWDNLKFQGNVTENYIVDGETAHNKIVLGNNTYLNLVGCGGTALGIIVKYWGDPDKQTSPKKVGCENILSYNSKRRIIRNNTSIVGANYDIPKSDSISVFNYTDMFSDDSSKKRKALALMFEYVTKACRTAYGPPGIGSSAALTDILYAIRNPLGFDRNAKIIKISELDKSEAVDLLYKELENGRPIIISGHNNSGSGHTFIIDGYRNSYNGVNGDYFHTILNTTTNAWYSLTPTTTSGVTHNWLKDLKAIIGIKPRRASSGIIGDVNGDGYVNMSDLTEVLHYSIVGKQLRRDLTIVNDSEGIEFTGRVDDEVNKLFFPLTGWKRSSSGVAYEKYSEGCYITTNNGNKTITRILRDGSIDQYTSNLFCCVRLVYKGNTPEADGAVDLGYYQTVYGGEDGPETLKLYFAPKNIGAENPEDTGDYFKRSTFNFDTIATLYSINKNKWRLPTHLELEKLFNSGYEYDPEYDVNKDGFIDIEDVNFIINKILGKFYRIYHSSTGEITEHTEKYMLYGDMEVSVTDTTDIFKDFVKPECYYGGFYKRRGLGTISFDPYSIDTAAHSSIELTYNGGVYDEYEGYYQSTFYLNEVPKEITVPIILGTGFVAIPWPTPITGASITVNATEITGSFSDSTLITNGTNTETLSNYIVFLSALTQQDIIENGITITTLDGVDVELTFTNNDFNTEYLSWEIAQL